MGTDSAFRGQVNGEFAFLSRSGAVGGHAAPVRLDELTHHCETDAEP